jgi:hypothetical protein
MAKIPPTLSKTGRGVNGSAFFSGGMSSAVDPAFIDDRAYHHAQNTIHRGGIVRTRPGYRQSLLLPQGNLQGFYYFRPLGRDGHYVAIVDGKVYETPLIADNNGVIAYTRLENIQFYPFAKEIYACVAQQTAKRNHDSTISLVSPQRILIFTDGGYTKDAYWDGNTNGHIDPLVTTQLITDAGVFQIGLTYTIVFVGTTDFTALGATSNTIGVSFVATGVGLGDGTASLPATQDRIGTPLGGPVEFSGDRLWVARDNLVFAGDISNPFSFEENQYAAEGGYFQFPDTVVALKELPSADNPVLLVFCVNGIWVLQSNIRDRSKWKTTVNFQTQLLPGVGCISSKSVIASYGLIWWMSPTGLVSLDSAQQARITSRLVPKDTDMAVSKINLSPDLSLSCLGFYENFLLCSVPNGDKYNRHTWVLDQSVISDSLGTATTGWSSIWTGTRPVQWATGLFNNALRCAHASKDTDGNNRVWESFISDNQDNGQPIVSFVETKTHLDFSPLAGGLDSKRFVFGEVTLENILGDVNLKVYWAGTRGRYKLLGNWNLKATEGSLQAAVKASSMETYTAQQRIISTPAVQHFEENGTCTVKGIESPNNDWVDIGFSLLIVWTGRAALRSYRIFADPFDDVTTGKKVFDETQQAGVPAGFCTQDSPA